MKWVKVNVEGQTKYGILNRSQIGLTKHTWSDILEGKPIAITGEMNREASALPNPVDRPGKIICVGLNYLDHCRETNTSPPERPLLFAKFPTSMIGPMDVIVWSKRLTNEVDFAAELAVVIGKTGRTVHEDEAFSHVAGYTVANDVSARDVQLGDGQWVRGKSLDTFCPVGPVFVTTTR